MDFVQTVADLDQMTDLHAARLLLLIEAFGENGQAGAIEGLTKLAKLETRFRERSRAPNLFFQERCK